MLRLSLGQRISKLLAALCVGASLFALDRALSPTDAQHSEWAGLRQQARALRGKPQAQIVTLGSSTIGQWLTPEELARLVEVPPNAVLDGALRACYASCSWAVAKRLRAQGHHFETAFLGVNLFSMCEGGAALRVMQNVELTPTSAVPELLWGYAFARSPSVYWGNWAAMAVSHAYRDSSYVQARAVAAAFGKRSEPDQWRLLTAGTESNTDPDTEPNIQDETAAKDENARDQTTAKQARQDPGWARCAYADDSVKLQYHFLKRLLQEVQQLAEHVYLLSLPQRSLAHIDESVKLSKQWQAHRAALQTIAEQNPQVTLLDLTQTDVDRDKFFRDAVHLSAAGIKHQSRQLKRLLAGAQ